MPRTWICARPTTPPTPDLAEPIPTVSHLDLDAWLPRAGGRVRVVPVVHESVESAAFVRAVLELLDVAAVAVELPRSFTAPMTRALRRLPRATALFDGPSGAATRLFVAAAGDPFVEGLRWAREAELPWALVDADIEYPHEHRDPVPDPYALWDLGPRAYFEHLWEAQRSETVAEDEVREGVMAYRLQELARSVQGEGEIVALVGALHVESLRSRVARPQGRPLIRELRSSVEARHIELDSLPALLADPPVLHAAWNELRQGPVASVPLPAAVASETLSLRAEGGGLRLLSSRTGEDAAHHDPSRRAAAIGRFVASRAGRAFAGTAQGIDRRRAEACLWDVAAASYQEQSKTSLAPWQRRVFHDFSRRYARIQDRLTGGLYEWTVAARGVADDVLAWEMFDAARAAPLQGGPQDLETVSVDGDELDLGTRKLRFRRWSFQVKRAALRLEPRPVPDDPEDWLRGFDGGMCSYPPEDVLIEDVGRELGEKAVSVLSTERSRHERFQSGLLDGIDLRETVRRRVSESQTPQVGPLLWVREEGRAPGDSGALVLVFDPDLGGEEKFPYRMTWLGEHDGESDMAFYSTPPLEQIVGPGILRATYGGLMMCRPPGRVYDIWQDPEYAGLGAKAETLLIAAIDYSEERVVTHVARDAPASWILAYARRQGKQIVHLPLASLSPRSMAKIRVVHLLSGRDTRDVAPRYIW